MSPPPSESAGPRRSGLVRSPELWTYALAVLVTCVATAVALQLWRADLRIPFVYYGDAVAIAAHVKTVLETGWYESQPLLAYPAGQAYHDFPTADNLNFAAARLLGLVSSDWAVVMNLYFLLGFPLAAAAMVRFLREVGVHRALTVALAVLYALAPYHFARGEGHLWLASYFTIPLALVAVIRAARGEALWGRGRGHRFVALLTGRGASTAVSLALVAAASSYYAVFVLVLLATAGLAAFLRERSWARLFGAAGAGVLTVAVMFANMAPDMLYRLQQGPSATGFVRSPAWVELYALKLAQLLLPVPGHRVGALAYVRQAYDQAYPLLSEDPSLGIVAACGVVAAMVLVVYTAGAQGRRRSVPALDDRRAGRTSTLSYLSMLVLMAFLFSTVGGLATFVSFLTASLRGWNRMVIVIAALALAIVGLVLQAWQDRSRWPARPRARRWGAWAVAGMVLVVGVADQTTPGAVPDYVGVRVAFEADARWFGQVEKALPEGSAVFQLPFAGFPETGPVNGVWDTDQLHGYLHSATLRWSGGGIKGRPRTDWASLTAATPPAQMVPQLAVAGFDAIMVDRQAYGAEAAATVESGLADEVGEPVAVSENGRYALFAMDDERAAIEAANDADVLARWRAAVTLPVMPYPSDDLDVADDAETGVTWTAASGSGSIVLDNPRPEAVDVLVSGTVASPSTAEATFSVAGTSTTVTSGPQATAFSFSVTVPAGLSTLNMTGSPQIALVVQRVEIAEEGLPALAR